MKVTTRDLVPIGAAARRFGVAVSTLRYWEERGLLEPAVRQGGRRWYGPNEMHRIGLIRMWQDTGLMSLDEIAALFAGADGERGWREIVLDRISAIDVQIERLSTGRSHLEHLLNCPQDNPAAECPHLRGVTSSWAEGSSAAPERSRRLQPPKGT